MKKAVALFTVVVAVAGCQKQEEPYEFGSSTAQTTGTMRAPEQPDNPEVTTMSGTQAGDAAAAPVAGDAQFVARAAVSGLAEVQLGRLAQTKAASAEVKQFAQMMVADHTAANDELKRIAMAKTMNVPAAPDAMHKATIDRLAALSGAAFDREYMAAMVKDHNAAVALFESEANGGTDAELKAFAGKTLPKLRQHQSAASELAARVGQQ